MRPDTAPNLQLELKSRLEQLLHTWTSVPADSHEVLPGEEHIVAAMRDVVRPMVEALGPAELRQHECGDLVARFGPPGDDGLLLQTYIVSQHGNLMDAPTASVEEDGADHGLPGVVIRGQGANQNKGPMAAAFTALDLLDQDLRRPVWLAVNTEGRSSHGGSERIIDELGIRSSHAVIATATDLAVSLGNRGRVDIHVTVPGRSAHSSQPSLGINPLPRAGAVIAALEDLELPRPHAALGPAGVTPYQLTFHPVAPHTLPSEGRLIVDRRLLPGEDPATATEQVRRHLQQRLAFEVQVEAGAVMLPAEVPADAPVVVGLQKSAASIGVPVATLHSRNTYDAGYGCSVGIPTVMFGPGRRSFGQQVLAAEVVSVEQCWQAAQIYAGLASRLCT